MLKKHFSFLVFLNVLKLQFCCGKKKTPYKSEGYTRYTLKYFKYVSNIPQIYFNLFN